MENDRRTRPNLATRVGLSAPSQSKPRTRASQGLGVDVFLLFEASDQTFNSVLCQVRRAYERQIHFLHGGREISMGAGHACEFSVAVPLSRMFLYVHFENHECFVLLFLELESAAIDVKLHSRCFLECLRFESRRFLFLPLRIQNL